MQIDLKQLSYHSLRAELTENPRLRISVGLIIAILLVWISLVWSDFNRGLFDHFQASKDELSSLSGIESSDEWQVRLEKLAAQESSLENTLWKAGSTGLAEARIQAALSTLVVKDSATRQRLQIGVPQPIDGFEGVSRLQVRVATSLTPEQLKLSLQNIENQMPRISVDRMVLRKDNLRWNVELIVTAHILTGDS